MVKYLKVPIIEELIRRVEEVESDKNATTTAAIGILNHYFPAKHGFAISSDRVSIDDMPDTSNIMVRELHPEGGFAE